MRNEFKKLIEAAKDYKEYQSIGNGAKLNCAIEAAELALQQPLVIGQLLADYLDELPENKPLYKDSGLWQVRSDDMEEVLYQQGVNEKTTDFIKRIYTASNFR